MFRVQERTKRGQHLPAIRWSLGGAPPNRIPGRSSDSKELYGSSRREVQERLTSALRDQNIGLPAVRNERQTLGQYLGRWLRDVAANSVRPKTLSTYDSSFGFT